MARRKSAPPTLGSHISEKFQAFNFDFSKKRLAVAITATTVSTMGSAQAATTTFAFYSSVKGQTSIMKSLDGINLTISNFQTGPQAGADSDGLAVYCVDPGPGWAPCTHIPGEIQHYSAFAMTFDQPVKLLSYNVSWLSGSASDSSTTYQQGTLQSIQVNNTGTGLKLFNNQFLAAANVPIAVTTTDPNGFGMVQINAFTVEKVDPVPGPLPLAGAAAAFSWSRGPRGRIRRTARV